ncbi:MAG: hypothetical protein JF616_18205 [Fibrobacteres bacterium]|jgi:hypothetical protein|nr:hypothetical protein [Fibrobacterota bacterium]
MKSKLAIPIRKSIVRTNWSIARTGLAPATLIALALLGGALTLLSGCGIFPSGLAAGHAGYRILDFTLLGDSAIALQLETWQVVNPPDTAPWPKIGFALLDRKTGQVRTLDDLPVSAAPTFPEWFFACDSGTPVSVHPAGFSGPAGTCVDTAKPAITANGYRAIYADTAGTVHLFNSNLEQFESLATGAWRVEALDAAFGNLEASILEWHGNGDSALWRGFAVDDPSGSDSVWLVSPREVRVHGQGTQLVCQISEESLGLPPCWEPPGIGGFREAFDEAAASVIRPEWDPDTGVLAYLEGPGNFVFLNQLTGGRAVLDAGAMLSAYRP